ncbi:hypothetical protein BVY05_20255 [Pectobacterium odoriferum]|nr:hypothetical protein BVY05_20255 [Pectobacterium odoriferum]
MRCACAIYFPSVYGSTGLRVYGSTGLRVYGSTGLRVYGLFVLFITMVVKVDILCFTINPFKNQAILDIYSDG